MDYKLVASNAITAQNAVSISNNLIFLYVVYVVFTVLLDGDKTTRDRMQNGDAMQNCKQAMENYLY